MTAGVDRHELRQIIAGLSEGVILVEPDQSIAYANDAALAMHGVQSLDELGQTVDAYRDRFALRYRNHRAPKPYPIERVVAGETFQDILVEVTRTDQPGTNFVHSLRSLVAMERVTIDDADFVLLVLQDITDRKHTERELFDAIEAVMADTSWFSRGLIDKLANLRRPGREGGDGSAPNLTVRERQILNLICSGLGDDAIADKLALSRNTVRNHGAALYRKLGIHKWSEAIIWGRENGFPLSYSE
ncbi:LuxR C-terminal-related transcriptional regulator [Methylobacterium sp. E-005]|uniref:LuxR C-terminal-related transcriptional regulator n=1 Tax=Methylobacterium sp. E-005 TaxID=2836549 RepID=UPI001FBBC14B|nr:LuxR C-terminal-related transcriptional regulator [Methylobacterium sp. E-005]MCJ2089931.1 LuxR C-terminal-related transcriptional regulator [Methylobacterium sp. E-005]